MKRIKCFYDVSHEDKKVGYDTFNAIHKMLFPRKRRDNVFIVFGQHLLLPIYGHKTLDKRDYQCKSLIYT